MRTRSKRLSGLVAVAAASLLAVTACGTGGGTDANVSAGFKDCESKPNDCNSGETKKGGTLTAALEKTIQNFNLLDADGNTADTGQVMAAVVPAVFNAFPDLKYHLNTDLMVSAEQTSTSPQTIVYKVKPEAVWNDGSPIGYEDFLYVWKVQNDKDCKACTVAGTTGYDQIESMDQSDGGKTITVKYKAPYPDWQSLFGSLWPASVAKKNGDLTSEAGLEKAFEGFKADAPTWSGHAYMISEYKKDASVTLVPNPKWYGKSKPPLDKIIWRVITDQAQQVPAMQNKEVQFLYSQPSGDMVNGVKNITNVNYMLGKGLIWEHFDFNLKNRYLSDVELRKALFTAVNVKDVIAKTVGQFVPDAKPLYNHNLVPGEDGYKDVVSATGQGSGDVDKAKKILTDAGYKLEGGKLLTKTGEAVPPLRCGFTEGNSLRQQSCELFQAAAKQISVDIKVEPFKSLGNTLSKGDFDVIIYAWVGGPAKAGAIDLWGTGKGSNYGNYSNAQVDQLLTQAAQELDKTKLLSLLNQSNEIMAKDAYVLPLFQKPTFLAIYNDYINIRDNATSSGPAYNVQEWGLKASAK